MDFVGLDGKIYPTTLNKKGNIVSGSKEERAVAEFLQDMFPTTTILRGFTIPGTRLSLDFFIPWFRMAIEVQGKQHFEHVEFFHDDKAKGGLRKQQENDKLKKQWTELNGIMLLCVETRDELEEMFKPDKNMDE